MNLKDVPIQKKLTTIVLLTSGVVLLLTCCAFIAYELVTFRTTFVNQMETMADVIAANSTGALAFSDDTFATGVLAAAHADENVRRAALYNTNGVLFARFPAHAAEKSFPPNPGPLGNEFNGESFSLFYPVVRGDTRLGTLYLEADASPLYQRLALYGAIVAVVLLGSFIVAFALSRWLQRSVTKPIVDLAATARAVSQQKNYLVRADKHGNDEIGQLTEAFNHMLSQIHERDLALMANQERLKLALSASQTGTWDWDLKTNKIVWDDFTHVLFGLRPGQFAGTYEHFISLIHPQDRVTVTQAVEQTLKTCKEFNVEFQVIWPDGSPHQIASRGKAIYDESGKPVRMSGVSLDITERKRAEEEIRTLNAELEERVFLRTAELLASNREMEAFTYSVSHDLRAPLRHIIAFTEILEEEISSGPLSPEARDYLNRIKSGARNMSQLVDDLLNLARIGRQGVNRQRVSLNDLVQEAIADLRPELEQRKVEWRIGPLPEADCDPGLIRQVFTNLLSNAIKYTRPRELAVIEIGEAHTNGQKAIFVRDNGVGFNMKFADKLFGVFQRLHRADEFEGTGVGLATVERIIHKHGGKVWAESELGQGATFYFTIGAAVRADGTRTGETTTFNFFRQLMKK